MDAIEMQNAIAAGAARYAQWKRNLLEEWQKGVEEGRAAAMFAMLPPQLKEVMKRVDPEQYQLVESALLRKRG